MLGKIENRSRTKKEIIHLQIDTTTEEEVGEPMQIAKKKVQKKQPLQRQRKRETQPKEQNNCESMMQKKRCQTLQPPTTIKRKEKENDKPILKKKKKENAKPVSESNKQQIEEAIVQKEAIQQTNEHSDRIDTLPNKNVSPMAKEREQETDIEALKSNNALNKNDLQAKKQTFSQKAAKPTIKNRKKVLGEIPSFNRDLKDEPSSQPDDLPATNHIDSSVNWTQLQVYKMLKPDYRRRITQFWSIDSSNEYWTAETTDFNYYRIMVLKEDLHSLMANGPPSTQIVDSFCYLKREKENITKQKNFYVSTTIFHNINEQIIETTLQNKERLYNQLMDQYGIVSKIFFPLFHYNHFSLVVLDTKNAKIIHYNSLQQSTTDEDLDFDCYWENAEIVIEETKTTIVFISSIRVHPYPFQEFSSL
ncbi:uncharacterized protein [Malus domestica]|uniref:uncharacterized protein n=1 Tax=Malus domestica TaxID=3750 RepID=UPI003976D9F2